MTMPYSPLFEFLILALLAKGMETFRWKIYIPALLTVIAPLAAQELLSLISKQSLLDAFSTSYITTLIFQYLMALVVFRFLNLYEDTIVVWFAWFIFGGVAIFMAIPAIVRVIGV